MPPEVFKQRQPVDTFATPPVASSGIFIIAEIAVEFPEYLSHLSGILYRNGPVIIAMKDIYTCSSIISCKFNDITPVTCPVQVLLNNIITGFWYSSIGRSVSHKCRITCARCNSCPFTGIGCTQIPCTMTPHWVAGKIYPGRIGSEFFSCVVQYLQCINPSPVLPVKSAGTPVGRGNEDTPVFRLIGSRLTYSLYTCTVNRQKQGRRIVILFAPRVNGIILDTSVDIADKCASVRFSLINWFNFYNWPCDCFVSSQKNKFTIRSCLPGNCWSIESEWHLPAAVRCNGWYISHYLISFQIRSDLKAT